MTTTRRDLLRTGLTGLAMAPVVGGASGCATLCDLLDGVVKKPDLALKSFEITKTTLSSFSVRLIALLKNPNPFGFRLDGLDWGVKLAGGAVAKGVTRGGITLKPRGTSQTRLDIDFDLARTAAAVLELIEKRSVALGIDAVGHLRANRFRFDVPASFETKLPMPQLPDFTVPKFAVKSASLSGIEFVVEPLVSNPNPFDIDIDLFDFDVKVGGRQVLRNKTLRNVSVASKQKKAVPFEFQVDLVELGLSAAQLATSPRLDWEVGSRLKSGILDLPFKQAGRVRL
jgi:LEA14-like dessication related protein